MSDGTSLLGQKTLVQPPSALDQMNVRFLVSNMKRELEEVCDQYLYGQPQPERAGEARAALEKYLANLRSMGYIRDYNTPEAFVPWRLHSKVWSKVNYGWMVKVENIEGDVWDGTYRFTSLRRMRVWAKRRMRHLMLLTLPVQPQPPTEAITIRITIKKEDSDD